MSVEVTPSVSNFGENDIYDGTLGITLNIMKVLFDNTQDLFSQLYGINLERFFFEQLDDTLLGSISAKIKTMLTKYFPTLTVVDVKVLKDVNKTTQKTELFILINFSDVEYVLENGQYIHKINEDNITLNMNQTNNGYDLQIV